MMQDIKMETFLAVCEYMNFTRAADALGLTQPAVSRQMKSLEEYYNVTLFHYEGKKCFSPLQGETLYRYAAVSRSDEKHLRKKLKEQAGRTLCLGATPTPGEFLIPQILKDYLTEFPASRVHIAVQNTGTLLKKLDKGELDMIIVEGNFPKKDYEYLLFSYQNYIPVGSSCRKFTDSSLEALMPYPIITREPGSSNREILEFSLKRHNILLSDFAGLIETNDIKVQKALVQQDLGITFLFEAAVKKERGLKILSIEGFPLKHEINIVWRKNSIFQEEYLKLARYFSNKAQQ